jgi:putative colanic acid biosynthesis glycosyltransferase WcaI
MQSLTLWFYRSSFSLHVLLLTHIFWPEIVDFKNLPLAQELVKHGHEVTVLTAFPNYPLGRLYDGYKLSWRQWEHIDGVRVLRVPLYPDHSSSGLKRVLNYGSFTLASAIIGGLLVRNVDVIFVYSPPMTLGFTAKLFKMMYKAPVLLDVVDLWPDAIAGSGMVSAKLVDKSSEWIAKTAYRFADKITVPTEGFLARLVQLSVPENKIAIMPHWADKRFYYEADRDPEFGDKYDLDGKTCIIHAGNIGPYQNIENILAAAELLRDVEQLRIIFVGGGRDLEEMKEQKELRKLKNIIFTGVYPTDKMSGILAWGDALLVSLRADPYLSINFPGKLPGYMAAGRPIIACAEGETRQVVDKNKLGLSCLPGDPAELCNTIRKFLSLTLQVRMEMGRNCRLLFAQRYDKDVLIGGYVRMLEGLNGCLK